MTYSTLFFDLDDTLYPSNSGLWIEIRSRMEHYMHDRLGLPLEKIPELRQTYLEKYGTTLRGLQNEYQVDPNDYLSFVHDVRLNQYIQPNHTLRDILLSLPQRRFVFTNSDTNHAQRVMNALGISDCFEAIIDIHAINYICKPYQEAYTQALSIAKADDPRKCVIFDDAPRNLSPARALGFLTVLVGSHENGSSDYHIAHLNELPHVMPELWDQKPHE